MASQLLETIRRRSVEEMEALLCQDISYLDLKYKCGYTPLHLAVKKRFYAGVDLLLAKGADINTTDEVGNIPLYPALIRFDEGMVRHLIAKGANVNHTNNRHETPLFITERIKIVRNTSLSAVRKKRLDEITKLLLSKQADINIQDINNDSILHLSCLHNCIRTVEHLINAGANVNSRNYYDETPLHIAARHGFVEAVELLQSKRAELNAQDRVGNTPLHISCFHGRVEIVEQLIGTGANVNLRNYLNETPLHIAALNESLDQWTWKKHKGLKREYYQALRIRNSTPLHIFCPFNSFGIIERLINAGAKLNLRNVQGETPLYVAARSSIPSPFGNEYIDTLHNNAIEVVKFLLKKGADVNISNENTFTPWMVALRQLDMCLYQSHTARTLLCQILLDWADWGFLLQTNYSAWRMFLALIGTDFTMDVVRKQTIKLKCANFPFDKHLAVTSENCNSWQLECLEELKKAKTTWFGRLSLYDILSNHHDPKYASNREIEQAVWSSCFDSQFPIYASLLQAKFTRDKKRHILLDSALDRLSVLLQASKSVNGIYLPNEILYTILLYTTDNDLKNIIIT